MNENQKFGINEEKEADLQNDTAGNVPTKDDDRPFPVDHMRTNDQNEQDEASRQKILRPKSLIKSTDRW
jgi:hypothetical protein